MLTPATILASSPVASDVRTGAAPTYAISSSPACMACISGGPLGKTLSETFTTPNWARSSCHQPLLMAVMSAIWWVLGWYPIRSSLSGAAVVGASAV